MKPEKTTLDKLTPSSSPYKVKVWVKMKTPPKVSPKKKVLYQHIILEDEMENTIKGTLFGSQIDEYKEAFEKGDQYEIANAPLKPVDPRFLPKDTPKNVLCEMTFGGQTSIQLLARNPDANSSSPKYSSIASIPRTATPNELFDVLGVVLFVEETRTITTHNGNPKPVREIIITDHSTKQPLIISAWGDLTGPECNLLASWANAFLIIGFTALLPSHHKGFSLATSMGTTFEHHPFGEKAETLRAWVTNNRSLLEDRMSRVLGIRHPSPKKKIVLIGDIDKKEDVWQDDTYWLQVTALDPQQSDITTYIGCNKCGKRTEEELSNMFTCPACSRDGCQAVKRVTFRFNATDESGTLKLTAFSKDCETLFGLPLDHLYDRLIDDSFIYDYKSFFEHIQDCPFYVQIGPTTALSRTGALCWCLRSLAWE